MAGRHLPVRTAIMLVVALVIATTSNMFGVTQPLPQAHAESIAAEETDDRAKDEVCPPSPDLPFEDVTASVVHRDAIACLAGTGVMLGISPSTFGPDRAVTREQIATFLSRFLVTNGVVLAEPEDRPFRDLGDSPHADNIEALASIGIVSGTSPTAFAPAAAVTRAQMATLIHQSLRELGIELPAEPADFADLNEGGIHVDAIQRLAAAGITLGRSAERYEPSATVTRAQLASFLLRATNVAHGRDAALAAPPVKDSASADRTEDASTTSPEASGAEQARLTGSHVGHGVELGVGHVGVVSQEPLVKSGPITTSRDGEVIEGMDISVSGRDNYAVVVKHDDVIVRNNRIRFPDGGQGIRVDDGADRVRIEHNQLDAQYLSSVAKGHLSTNNNVGQRGMSIHGADATVHRNHVVFVRSGIQLRGDGARVTENFIQELANAEEHSPDEKPLHGTGISMPGGIHNVVVARNRVPSGSSGGIIIYAEYGAVTNVAVQDNLVVGTGDGFAIRGGRTHLSKGNYDDNRDIRIDGNRFTGEFGFPNVLGDGTNAAVDLSRSGNTFATNRWVGSNTDLPARCGTTQNACD